MTVIHWLCAHSRLGFCWWDIVALIVLIIVIVNFVNKNRELKEDIQKLEDKIEQLRSQNTEENSNVEEGTSAVEELPKETSDAVTE